MPAKNNEFYDLLNQRAEFEREEEHHFQLAKRALERLASARRRLAAVNKKLRAIQQRQHARRKDLGWQGAVRLDPTYHPEGE